MVRAIWERPSIAVAAAAVFLVTVFVVRGDLRIDGTAKPRGANGPSRADQVAASPGKPAGAVVVKPERSSRPAVAALPVRGRVFDAMGFLVVGAEVRSVDHPTVRTDAEGAFRTEVGGGGLAVLLVQAKGYRASAVQVASASPDALFVQLAPAAPWDVEVRAQAAVPPVLLGEGTVRGADGKPLVGAYVTVQGSGVWSRTDEIGRYVLPLPEATATLVVHQPEAGLGGHGFAVRSEPITVARSRGVVPLPELVAEPAAAIHGTLRDDRGTPLAGVPVQVRGEGITRVFESGVSGVFRLAGLLPGRYEVRPFAFRGLLGRRQQVVVDKAVVACEVQLQAPTERRLRILDERGAPVGLAYVAADVDGERSCVAQADAAGWAALRVAADTQFEVRAAEGFAALPVQRFESEAGSLIVALP